MTAFQTACAAISYKGGVKQRKTGEALREYIKYFNEASAVNKKVLFVLTTAKADDDVTEPAKMLVNKGVSIFAIGIGKNVQPTDLKSISRYFLVTKWRGLLTSMVKIQNSLIKGMCWFVKLCRFEMIGKIVLLLNLPVHTSFQMLKTHELIRISRVIEGTANLEQNN